MWSVGAGIYSNGLEVKNVICLSPWEYPAWAWFADQPLPEARHSETENSPVMKEALRVNNNDGPPTAVPSGRVQISRRFGSAGDHDHSCYGYERSTPRILSRSYEGNDKCISRKGASVASPIELRTHLPCPVSVSRYQDSTPWGWIGGIQREIYQFDPSINTRLRNTLGVVNRCIIYHRNRLWLRPSSVVAKLVTKIFENCGIR